MVHNPVRVVAFAAVLAVVAAACGGDRNADTTSTAPPTTSGTTTPATTSPGDTTPASTLPPQPMFGDAPWPCGPGTGANTDDGSEVGVTADSIDIATGDDAGYVASPGLNHEMTDAMKALVAKCNDLGGINGRTINLNYYDAKILDVATAIQSACDDGNFFLVGEGWAFDANQEEIRLRCNLPAVPAYSVSAAFAHGRDVYMGVPNPSDETTSGYFAQMAKLFPEETKHVGTLAGAIGFTQETRDKVVAVAPEFGWAFAETTLEFSIGGEPDWTPFVKQLEDVGAQMVSYHGTCLPSLLLFAQTAKVNGFDVPIVTDANHYTAQCAAANTNGALDKLYVRMAFVPFEEASANPATQDYVDLISESGGDVAMLGAQATSSFLLWATAASACGATLTRECVLKNLADTHSWTGHGLHAEADPGSNHPPKCSMILHLVGQKYERVVPADVAAFECNDAWISSVTGTAALAAARLDANRISQQYTGG